MARRAGQIQKAHREALEKGFAQLKADRLFGGLIGYQKVAVCGPDSHFARDGYARVLVTRDRHTDQSFARGRVRKHQFEIQANGLKRLDPEEWANVLAQCTLHIVLNHCDPARSDEPWRIACELEAMDMLRALGVGRRPIDRPYADVALPGRKLEVMAETLHAGGGEALAMFAGHGIGGLREPGWLSDGDAGPLTPEIKRAHSNAFAAAIRASLNHAVELAGNAARTPGRHVTNPNSIAGRSRARLMAEFPLLSALAAGFDMVESAQACDQLGIAVAAVDAEAQLIYINPRFPWTAETMDFALAHELLHVGLRHEERRQGRDPLLWNVACDFVINGWLVEMGVGQPPTDRLFLDPELTFEKDSAEAIYDRMARDLRLLRRASKLGTLRGYGVCDLLSGRPSRWWTGPGETLDAFYRRALGDGLDLHRRTDGRSLLPGALVEEIKALAQPPIAWDVKLGQWLDAFFPPLESTRSYRRASRRQASSPDVPRAIYIRPPDLLASRTFGVVLDTSGSMSRKRLAQALGAIASYALSRDVPLVRLVQCDAAVHDSGYVEPEALAGRVEVRGRGGTVLAPALHLLETAQSFPRDAPVLVITDGLCDRFTVGREHAFLMPHGKRLPFPTDAPVFHFEGGDLDDGG